MTRLPAPDSPAQSEVLNLIIDYLETEAQDIYRRRSITLTRSQALLVADGLRLLDQQPAPAPEQAEVELPAHLREFANAMSEAGRDSSGDEYARCLEVVQKRLADSMSRSDSLWLNNFEVPVVHAALAAQAPADSAEELAADNKRLRAAINRMAHRMDSRGAEAAKSGAIIMANLYRACADIVSDELDCAALDAELPGS